MDEKDNKLVEPRQPGELFLAELFKEFTSKLDRQNKYRTVYANNFHFEPSVWDLKIMLGQLEQYSGPSVIDWHTAVTIPWVQAKFFAYYLRLQDAWYEATNGPIKAPMVVTPKAPEPPTGETANDPVAVAWYEAAKKIHTEMFGG